MKNITLFITLIILVLLGKLSNCQQDSGDKQIIQLATGNNKITFNVLDYETNEPLIGVNIYSFNLEKTLATTDIDGIAIIEKGVKGILEVQYIGYDRVCFKILADSVDNVIVRLRNDLIVTDEHFLYRYNIDSVRQAAKQLAHNKISKGDLYLFYIDKPTEEQQMFAKDHSFTLKEWKGKYPEYKQSFNEIVMDYLFEKFNINIREELRELCWKF